MKNFEILKKAQALLENLIVARTPSAVPALRAASEKLNKAIGLGRGVEVNEVLPQEFQMAVYDVVHALDGLHSGVATNLATSYVHKEFEKGEFAKLVRETLEKAIKEPSHKAALDALHGLRTGIVETLSDAIKKAESFEDDTQISVKVQNDPAAIVPTLTSGSIVAQGTGPDAQATNAAPAALPTSSSSAPESVGKAALDHVAELAAAAEAVNKATREIGETGWTRDLNSRAFMEGESRNFFGSDNASLPGPTTW